MVHNITVCYNKQDSVRAFVMMHICYNVSQLSMKFIITMRFSIINITLNVDFRSLWYQFDRCIFSLKCKNDSLKYKVMQLNHFSFYYCLPCVYFSGVGTAERTVWE